MINTTKTTILLNKHNHMLTTFGLTNQPRSKTTNTINTLREHIIILTKNTERVATTITRTTHITNYRTDLLPKNKLTTIHKLQTKKPITIINNNINNTPTLTTSNIKITINTTSNNVTLETTNVALITNKLNHLPTTITHNQLTIQMIQQNIMTSLTIKTVFVILTPLNLTTLIITVTTDINISLLVTLNALHLLHVHQSPINHNSADHMLQTKQNTFQNKKNTMSNNTKTTILTKNCF